nr:MAG TPA: hypothetical protein [Caudoviricetes sp.]
MRYTPLQLDNLRRKILADFSKKKIKNQPE